MSAAIAFCTASASIGSSNDPPKREVDHLGAVSARPVDAERDVGVAPAPAGVEHLHRHDFRARRDADDRRDCCSSLRRRCPLTSVPCPLSSCGDAPGCSTLRPATSWPARSGWSRSVPVSTTATVTPLPWLMSQARSSRSGERYAALLRRPLRIVGQGRRVADVREHDLGDGGIARATRRAPGVRCDSAWRARSSSSPRSTRLMRAPSSARRAERSAGRERNRTTTWSRSMSGTWCRMARAARRVPGAPVIPVGGESGMDGRAVVSAGTRTGVVASRPVEAATTSATTPTRRPILIPEPPGGIARSRRREALNHARCDRPVSARPGAFDIFLTEPDAFLIPR